MEALSVFSLPPGFGFHPTDVELVSHYLKRKILGLKIDYELIPEVEIYKHEPWDLSARCQIPTRDCKWHFFASRDKKYPNGSRTNRATEAGYWKSTGKDRNIRSHNRVIGAKKTLVFHEGRPPCGKRTEWIMHEFYINESECKAAPNMKADSLISEEIQFLRVAMGHENESLDDFVKARDACQEDLMYFPARNNYGLGSVAGHSEKLAALQNEYEIMKKKMDDEAKKATRLEQKIKVLTHGYQTRGSKLWSQIEATYKQMDTAATELECFQTLHKQELLAASHRVNGLREEVDNQKELERSLQHRYGDIVAEYDRIQRIVEERREHLRVQEEVAAKNRALEEEAAAKRAHEEEIAAKNRALEEETAARQELEEDIAAKNRALKEAAAENICIVDEEMEDKTKQEDTIIGVVEAIMSESDLNQTQTNIYEEAESTSVSSSQLDVADVIPEAIGDVNELKTVIDSDASLAGGSELENGERMMVDACQVETNDTCQQSGSAVPYSDACSLGEIEDSVGQAVGDLSNQMAAEVADVEVVKDAVAAVESGTAEPMPAGKITGNSIVRLDTDENSGPNGTVTSSAIADETAVGCNEANTGDSTT